MKIYRFKIISLMSIIVLIFSSCNKNDIKNANKYIIGTWTFVSENNESHNESVYTIDEITSYCEDEPPTDSKVVIDRTYSYNNKKFILTYTKTLTYDGQVYTTEVDTTVVVDNTSTITFYEDGTCIIKKYTTNLDIPFENPLLLKYDYSEISGFWNWIDSYKENAGIRIVLRVQSDWIYNFKIIDMIIKELSKDKFEYSYTYSNKYSGNNNNSGFCWNGTEYSYKSHFTTTDNGSGATFMIK